MKDKSPEALAAEIWRLSAQTMALEVMLVSLIEVLGRGSRDGGSIPATVLIEAFKTATTLAEHGVGGADTDVHFSRILKIIRDTAMTLEVADKLPP